jgi:hypothetical protein
MFRIILIIFLFPFLINAKTLYLSIVDTENTQSFFRYFSDLNGKVQSYDKFIVLDAQTSQMILDEQINGAETVAFNKENALVEYMDNYLNGYIRLKNDSYENKKLIYNITNQKNDFARQLKTVKDFILIYKKDYKKIKVIFFGNSYLHNAYGHNFNKGIPSDGFIYLEDSEFNTFEDINTPDVEFAIFYDRDPRYMKNQMFRFYRKLLNKKFNTTLNSFNQNVTFDADENFKYDNKPFNPNNIKVIGKVNKDECTQNDKVKKNDLRNIGKIEIEVKNICLRNSIVSFFHNGVETQKLADRNGKVNAIFKKQPGMNKIEYRNFNGKKIPVFSQNVHDRDDNIKFKLEESTKTVTITGDNPLRTDGSQIEMLYENTGSIIYPEFKNGKFKKVVSIIAGKNIFKWKDSKGIEKTHIINLDLKCVDKVKLIEDLVDEYGIAKVELQNSCREDGSLVTFKYKGKDYKSVIQSGKTQIDFILKSEINDIYYIDFEKELKQVESIKISNFKDLIRFSITYQDNVDIEMNIFEPSFQLSTPIKSFDYTNRNLDKNGHSHWYSNASTKGKLIIHNTVNIDDYYKEEFIANYLQVYSTKKSRYKNGSLLFYLDYFSRHGIVNNSIEPLCGERSLGGVVVEYEILQNGIISSGKKFLNPSRCEYGKPIPSDYNMIFIKKVDIK